MRMMDIPKTELEAKYATADSQFMMIDGARIHYMDQGEGPALILIHAQFSSLFGWEPWVEGLKDNYRVIRFDLTSHGLTGPDPSGDYTMARTMYLTEQFIENLQLDTFSIAGTSVGGGGSVGTATASTGVRFSSAPQPVARSNIPTPRAASPPCSLRTRSI